MKIMKKTKKDKNDKKDKTKKTKKKARRKKTRIKGLFSSFLTSIVGSIKLFWVRILAIFIFIFGLLLVAP